MKRWSTSGLWVAMVALAVSPLMGQSQTPQASSDLEFDVASVKPVTLSANTFQSGYARTAPGDFRSPATTTHLLLLRAFELKPYALVGEPSWTNSEWFEIQAKGAAGRGAKDVPAMLRSMLRNRFALRTHTEMRDLPSFVLSLARDDKRLGSRLKPTSPECIARIEAQDAAREAALKSGQPPPPPTPASFENFERQMDRQPCGVRMMSTRGGALRQSMGGMPMATIMAAISTELGGPVVDATGLSGRFDVDLEYMSERGMMIGGMPMARPGLSATTPGVDAEIPPPPLEAALKEQLGLKVEKAIKPVEVLVVDSIERPTPD